MRRIAGTTGLLVTLALAAACGAEDSGSGATGPDGPADRLTDRPSPTDPSPRPQVVCAGDDPVGVERVAPDFALGHRYLLVAVRNCSDAPVVLERPELVAERPELVAADPRGGDVELSLAPTPVAPRPDRPLRLRPGAAAYAGFAWLAEPRNGWVTDIRLVAADGDAPSALWADEPDIRPRTRLDYYPWTTRADGVWND